MLPMDTMPLIITLTGALQFRYGLNLIMLYTSDFRVNVPFITQYCAPCSFLLRETFVGQPDASHYISRVCMDTPRNCYTPCRLSGLILSTLVCCRYLFFTASFFLASTSPTSLFNMSFEVRCYITNFADSLLYFLHFPIRIGLLSLLPRKTCVGPLLFDFFLLLCRLETLKARSYVPTPSLSHVKHHHKDCYF